MRGTPRRGGSSHPRRAAGGRKDNRVPKKSGRQHLVLGGVGLLVVLALLALFLSCSGPTEQIPKGADTVEETPTEPSSESGESSDDRPSSTLQDQWRQGEMPYLYQTDPQWADVAYSNGSLAEQGCGPTALSMVYIYLTGKTDLDPGAMAAFSTENGYATDQDGSSWELMTEGARKLGLASEVLAAVPSQLEEKLETGHPLICVMRPGTFTKVGHYIVLERMGQDEKVVVHDSNSVGRSMRTWDLDLICAEASNIWSFSLASGLAVTR